MPGVTEQLSTALADRYVIEQELGAGGMATVYLAHDVKHDRKVALKVLHPHLLEAPGFFKRFLREADTLEFTVKVVNTSPTTQSGSVRLSLAEARTGDSADEALGNTGNTREFEIPANESRTFSWKLTVPDGTPFLTYRAVASTGRLSDGEEGYLPVLPRRILVTESLPLPVRDAGSHAFEFDKLLASGDSDSLQHESLTVQMVSNPAWYAVMIGCCKAGVVAMPGTNLLTEKDIEYRVRAADARVAVVAAESATKVDEIGRAHV